MASVHGRGLHRASVYLHQSRRLHRFQSTVTPRHIHHSAKRRCSTNPAEQDITKKKPNYVSRILFTSAVVGGSYAYSTGLSDDIIAFFKQRFALVEALTNESESFNATKLPKPNKPHKSESTTSDLVQSNATKALPPPSLSDITLPPSPSSSSRLDSTPSKPSQPVPEIIESPKSEPLDLSKIPEKVESVMAEIKEDVAEISEEVHQRYRRLKEEVSQLVVSSETVDAVDNVMDVAVCDISEKHKDDPMVYESEEERLRAEVAALTRSLEQHSLSIEELERELKDKSEFIRDNLKKLEEGRNAYDEVARIFEEMRVEYQESMIQQMEHMENERRDRMNKLRKFSVDIRVMEQIMNWYDTNNRFFMDLAELNNVVHKFEQKMNSGLAFDNELQYLLKTIPSSFVSHQLLTDLSESANGDPSFHINSQKQLYDRFTVLENALRQTAMTPKSTESLWGNLLAKVFASLLVREEIDRKGTSLNDRISRAGYSMKFGDLQSALSELNYLDEDLLFPAQNWLKCARQRLLGLSAVRMVKSELLSRSVKMVQSE